MILSDFVLLEWLIFFGRVHCDKRPAVPVWPLRMTTMGTALRRDDHVSSSCEHCQSMILAELCKFARINIVNCIEFASEILQNGCARGVENMLFRFG